MTGPREGDRNEEPTAGSPFHGGQVGVAAVGAGMAFVVTDDDRRFQAVVRRLPEAVEPVRLYESYLSNFRFVSGE